MEDLTLSKTIRETAAADQKKARFARHGWIGLALIGVFWPLNWLMPGMRTLWAFFPLWLGYCLTVDALVLRTRGTSLLARSGWGYLGLFLISAPAWWLFEALNQRIQNWVYLGSAGLTPLSYFLFATLNFSVVIPAVFGAAELAAGAKFIREMKPWLVIRGDRKTMAFFFLLGWVMLGLMLAWPRYFFPFAWLSVLFILEPVNVWLGNFSLTQWTSRGDWRPVVSLFLGGLLTGFFWEMWNYFAYPKWIYQVPGVSFLHIFEMPLLGYLGYFPFALELFALYHLVMGFLGEKRGELLNIGT
ncbi:MAG TPA: hypothetical protein VF813_01010 [Anaerolineaceae bacterium]